MIGILPFLLSSCFSYYDKAERLAVMGIIDSDKDRKDNYDIGEASDFKLVYLFNGDTADVPVDVIFVFVIVTSPLFVATNTFAISDFVIIFPPVIVNFPPWTKIAAFTP